jgi:hypothetical protein
MSDNVNRKVRGIDIAIDYDHNPGPAAGWVQTAEVKDNGLWLQVEWTPDAAEKLRKREYRYFSPEFSASWTDPKSSVKHQDVLMGGGLTNRPFLKDLLPVNLSEILGGDYTLDDEGHVVMSGKVVYSSKGESMELLKKLAEALGIKLAEDADEAAITAAFKTALDAKKEPEQKVLAEAEIAKLVEAHPALASLVEVSRAQQKTIDILTAANKLSDVRLHMTEWQKGDKFGIPVALTESVTNLMLSANTAQMGLLVNLFTELCKTGLVALGETPKRKPGLGGTDLGDVFAEVDALVKTRQKDNPKLSDHEALDKIFDEDAELYERYRKASYTSEPQDEEVQG